ncbi:HEAT repeat domain-containing protein [Spirochaeta cellobiosiphila]|uniref:HEAT repeat domain-containing protein n=1 Tax=Spirochaeta cellobiosiphila TaxID=504483 RepID=UPI00040B97D5|nr:HEAT repeat domain-containing protein [Spirochaeta cellobiosiphila]
MRKVFIFQFFLCITIINGTMYAQDTNNQQTIEDLYLQSTIEVQVIATQANQDSREMKMLALNNIREMVDRGDVSGNSLDVIDVLRELGSEGTTKEVRLQGRLSNNYPMVRKESAKLLGDIGGEAARSNLIQMIRNDDEPTVISEAVYAIGKIGVDEKGIAFDVIAEALRKQNNTEPDNNLAFATLLAYEKIAEQQGGITDSNVYESIILIAQGNYVKDVKSKAVALLDKLRKMQ